MGVLLCRIMGLDRNLAKCSTPNPPQKGHAVALRQQTCWFAMVVCCWMPSLCRAEPASAKPPPMMLVVDSASSDGTAATAGTVLPPLAFAASEIRRAFTDRGVTLVELDWQSGLEADGAARLFLAATPQACRTLAERFQIGPAGSDAPQSYAVRRAPACKGTVLAVLSADAAGAMYGGLDLAEAVRLRTLDEVGDSDHTPFIARRGIKFNIPLDARTPSYSDNSDAAQQNIAEMWSFDFWREFLDEMARHRFNVLTLWNLHPFPSLVQVPEFPDVALADIKRTTLPLDETFSHTGSDMVRPAMLENLQTVKRLSIGEKIQFWRDVMQHAHDRGIEVYLFTWNMFTFAADGKHGITSSQTNETTIAYFRASVRETVLTYPRLAGIGITAGERLENRSDQYGKEQWLWRTYGEGVRDAVRLQPERQVRLIHRFHQTGQAEILRQWQDYPGPLDLSFKYAIAHMYAATNPPFIHAALPHLPPDRRTWLTVRNDDIYSFRWGDPQFAREFVRAMPRPDRVAGFYMGPDGYVWGREFLSTEPETPRELVIRKQWFSFLLWGRLSYDPDLPDQLFQQVLAQRFPEVPAGRLLAAWSQASRIFPQITRFFWGDIDLRWFPEACLSHPRHKGFYTVRDFIEGHTMPGSGILDVLTWRRGVSQGAIPEGQTPPQVADALAALADDTLRGVAELRPHQGANKELRLTLGDLEAFAHLGNYYAGKIRGACALSLFDATGEPVHRESAVGHLTAAAAHWQRYATVYTRQYIQPVLYNRVGFVDIPKLAERVAEDLQSAQQWKPGTILERQDRKPQADTPFRR